MAENFVKISSALLSLNVGDIIQFPIVRMKSVRVQACELGTIYERKFKTKTDKEKRIILVERVV